MKSFSSTLSASSWGSIRSEFRRFWKRDDDSAAAELAGDDWVWWRWPCCRWLINVPFFILAELLLTLLVFFVWLLFVRVFLFIDSLSLCLSICLWDDWVSLDSLSCAYFMRGEMGFYFVFRESKLRGMSSTFAEIGWGRDYCKVHGLYFFIWLDGKVTVLTALIIDRIWSGLLYQIYSVMIG